VGAVTLSVSCNSNPGRYAAGGTIEHWGCPMLQEQLDVSQRAYQRVQMDSSGRQPDSQIAEYNVIRHERGLPAAAVRGCELHRRFDWTKTPAYSGTTRTWVQPVGLRAYVESLTANPLLAYHLPTWECAPYRHQHGCRPSTSMSSRNCDAVRYARPSMSGERAVQIRLPANADHGRRKDAVWICI